jgi:hypothetical protein
MRRGKTIENRADPAHLFPDIQRPWHAGHSRWGGNLDRIEIERHGLAIRRAPDAGVHPYFFTIQAGTNMRVRSLPVPLEEAARVAAHDRLVPARKGQLNQWIRSREMHQRNRLQRVNVSPGTSPGVANPLAQHRSAALRYFRPAGEPSRPAQSGGASHVPRR